MAIGDWIRPRRNKGSAVLTRTHCSAARDSIDTETSGTRRNSNRLPQATSAANLLAISPNARAQPRSLWMMQPKEIDRVQVPKREVMSRQMQSDSAYPCGPRAIIRPRRMAWQQIQPTILSRREKINPHIHGNIEKCQHRDRAGEKPERCLRQRSGQTGGTSAGTEFRTVCEHTNETGILC